MMEEAVAWGKSQGAPGDQNALIGLLKEVQQEEGLTPAGITEIAGLLNVKESLLLALIRRIPSLKLDDTHILQLCAGPNCGKCVSLAKAAEQLCKGRTDIKLEFTGCMRLCGKGPNLKLDGKIYHRADEALLKKLL